MRTGLIARKEGMSRVFDAEGRQVPVTVLKVDDCQVVSVRSEAKDGYVALQIGAGKAKVKRTSKSNRGHFAKAKVEPKKNSPNSVSRMKTFSMSGPNWGQSLRTRPVRRCYRHDDR